MNHSSSHQAPIVSPISRSGGVLTGMLVFILLVTAVFLGFSRIADLPPTDPTSSAEKTAEPFLELNSPQVVETIAEYTQDDLRTLTDLLSVQEKDELDRAMPSLRVGDEATLRQLNGVIARGKILALDPQEATLEQGSLTNRIPINTLDARDRLRADPALRAHVSHLQALALARAELETLGSFPAVEFADPASMQNAAQAGEFKAQNEWGMRMILSRETGTDTAQGFYLIQQAAQRGLPAAQHNMGVLYARGLAVGQHRESAAKWFSLAARNQWKQAQDFLNENKVPADRVNAWADEMGAALSNQWNTAQARVATLKAKTLETALQVPGRVYRPDGHSFTDFKLRYYWWMADQQPALRQWFDAQGRRHISSAPAS